MGSQSLKNIADPMRAWRVRLDRNGHARHAAKAAIETSQLFALPDKPSISSIEMVDRSIRSTPHFAPIWSSVAEV